LGRRSEFTPGVTDWLAVDPQVDAALPLAGVRVLDLSRILAGPFAATVLSDLGADVIKVERPGTGDDTRRWGPPFRGGEATYFLSVNRNRRSITLDLQAEEGREILSRLVGAADVVLENFLPHQLVALGLDAMRCANPHVAWVSIRAASSDGPLGALPGFDAMAQARSGLMSITGTDAPTKVGVAIADVVTGLYAAVAALALLLRKGRGDAPSVAEVPLLECALAALVNQAANYLLADVTPGRMGNEHPNLAPYGSFECSDGWLFVGAGTDRQFRSLADVLGLGDARFATNALRIEHRVELNDLIARALAGEPRAVWGARFDDAGVPWAPVNDVAEAFADEHVRAVGLVGTVAMGDDTIAQVRSPIAIDGARPEPRSAPPSLGQDTAAILRHLGYDTDRIEKLRAASIL
jgi:crotonobetainyl-CoA:carnitine CoA-transferase CaiB-like acyl-CoA transferase